MTSQLLGCLLLYPQVGPFVREVEEANNGATQMGSNIPPCVALLDFQAHAVRFNLRRAQMLASVLVGDEVQCDVYEQGCFHLEWVARFTTTDFSLQRMSSLTRERRADWNDTQTIADPMLRSLIELVLLRRPAYRFSNELYVFHRYLVQGRIGVFYSFRCIWKCKTASGQLKFVVNEVRRAEQAAVAMQSSWSS